MFLETDSLDPQRPTRVKGHGIWIMGLCNLLVIEPSHAQLYYLSLICPYSNMGGMMLLHFLRYPCHYRLYPPVSKCWDIPFSSVMFTCISGHKTLWRPRQSLPYILAVALQDLSFWVFGLSFSQKAEDLKSGSVLETGQGITSFYWVVALSYSSNSLGFFWLYRLRNSLVNCPSSLPLWMPCSINHSPAPWMSSAFGCHSNFAVQYNYCTYLVSDSQVLPFGLYCAYYFLSTSLLSGSPVLYQHLLWSA